MKEERFECQYCGAEDLAVPWLWWHVMWSHSDRESFLQWKAATGRIGEAAECPWCRKIIEYGGGFANANRHHETCSKRLLAVVSGRRPGE